VEEYYPVVFDEYDVKRPDVRDRRVGEQCSVSLDEICCYIEECEIDDEVVLV